MYYHGLVKKPLYKRAVSLSKALLVYGETYRYTDTAHGRRDGVRITREREPPVILTRRELSQRPLWPVEGESEHVQPETTDETARASDPL